MKLSDFLKDMKDSEKVVTVTENSYENMLNNVIIVELLNVKTK